jgi:hypothetical protein
VTTVTGVTLRASLEIGGPVHGVDLVQQLGAPVAFQAADRPRRTSS